MQHMHYSVLFIESIKAATGPAASDARSGREGLP